MSKSDWSENPLELGRAVIVRTVTHTYIGKVVRVVETHEGLPAAVVLNPCAWIGDTGSDAQARWGRFLASGLSTTTEVEPYPGPVLLNWPVVVDVSPWLHDVPTEAQ